MTTATAKHTPGPWRTYFESPACEWKLVVDRGGGIVCNVNSETGPDATSAPATRKMPIDANARLIAAAPDLLDALIESTDAARLAGIHQGPDTADDLPWYAAALAAIAKATT